MVDDFDLRQILREGDLDTWPEYLTHNLRGAFESQAIAVLFLFPDTDVDRKGQTFAIRRIQPGLPFSVSGSRAGELLGLRDHRRRRHCHLRLHDDAVLGDRSSQMP